MNNLLHLLVILALIAPAWPGAGQRPAAATYYVSASQGSDTNDGLSTERPIKTMARVNALALKPGDSVRLRCGDTWRAEILRVTASGAEGQPITYGSYPDPLCEDQPVLSGSQPVSGWTRQAANIYVASLSAAANAGLFPPATTGGLNQLFRNGVRLGVGRWPNSNAPDGGYASIDTQPSARQISDSALPPGSWSGAALHVKGMRWYILNRTVTAHSGQSLIANADLDCWEGCAGWGYWLSDHLQTLDRDGEWYYDPAGRKVYLYSPYADPNTLSIEASVIITGESAYMGGIILGRHLQEHVAHIVIENLEIKNWFDNGITTPVNLEKDENSYLVLRNNYIHDVDGSGINLQTWVWNAAANGNGYNGWRGGHDLQIISNTVVGANHMGINLYARQSLVAGNVVRDIALIANLGKSGMGCSTASSEGGCTEDGDGIRIKTDQDGTYSGNHLTVRQNRLERIGYNGMDVFGYNNNLEENVIINACYSKGDCGGIRTYGGSDLASSPVHDITIRRQVIIDPTGNTDGTNAKYRPLFGMGLYIDHNSRNVTAQDNTIIHATFQGLLYQDSTGTVENNLLFQNSAGSMYAAQVALAGSSTLVAPVSGNILLAARSNARTLQADSQAQLQGSDSNHFYHSSQSAHISVQGSKSLAQWRAYSGQDLGSTELVSSTLALAEVFYNDTFSPLTISLLRPYRELLSGISVTGTLSLAPLSAQVLIPTGPAEHSVFLPAVQH